MILLKLVLMVSLKNLWGLLNILQIIMFFYLIKVNLAPHARWFLEEIKVIAFGEFIPYEWLNSKAQEKFPDHFNRTDETTFIEKAGSVLPIGIALIIVYLIVWLLGRIKKVN